MNACAFLYRPVPLFTLFERIPPPTVNNQTYSLLHSKGPFIYYVSTYLKRGSKMANFFLLLLLKGQIISECPYEIIVCPKIATKKFPRFLPWPLRRGQIKNFIKPIMLSDP